VLLQGDSVLGGECYRTLDRYRHESPSENEEKRVYDQNGGWEDIVWAGISAQGSIELCSVKKSKR